MLSKCSCWPERGVGSPALDVIVEDAFKVFLLAWTGRRFSCLRDELLQGNKEWMNEDKLILLGYTYKIYNSGYNTEMINKQCDAGDPLERMI